MKRAEEILKELEQGNPVASRIKASKKKKQEAEEGQMMLIQSDDSEVVKRLREVDVDKMTPVQALLLLSELKSLI